MLLLHRFPGFGVCINMIYCRAATLIKGVTIEKCLPLAHNARLRAPWCRTAAKQNARGSEWKSCCTVKHHLLALSSVLNNSAPSREKLYCRWPCDPISRQDINIGPTLECSPCLFVRVALSTNLCNMLRDPAYRKWVVLSMGLKWGSLGRGQTPYEHVHKFGLLKAVRTSELWESFAPFMF